MLTLEKGSPVAPCGKKGGTVGAMSPAHYLSKPGGGGGLGGGSHRRTGPGRPPGVTALLQLLHLQPIAALEVLTALADHLAGLSSILETEVEGGGRIDNRSPAPAHRQQLVSPHPPARHPFPKTCPQPKTNPNHKGRTNNSPQNNTNANPKPKAPSEPPPPKEEEASRRVLLGALLGLLLLLLLLPYLHALHLFCALARARQEDPLALQREDNPPRPPEKAPKPSPKPPLHHRTPASPIADMPRIPPPAQAQAEAQGKGDGGGGCKYKAGENNYVGFCDKGVWGIEHGKEALAAGGPPPKQKHG